MNYLNKITNIIYYIAAALMPSILLFRLYNQNYAHNYIVFSHVLFIAGILAVLGILLFIFFKWATGTKEGSLITSGMVWVCFWLFGAVMGRARIFFPTLPEPVLMAAMIAVVAIAALLLRKLNTLSKTKTAIPEAKTIFATPNTPDGMIDTLADDNWIVKNGIN